LTILFGSDISRVFLKLFKQKESLLLLLLASVQCKHFIKQNKKKLFFCLLRFIFRMTEATSMVLAPQKRRRTVTRQHFSASSSFWIDRHRPSHRPDFDCLLDGSPVENLLALLCVPAHPNLRPKTRQSPLRTQSSRQSLPLLHSNLIQKHPTVFKKRDGLMSFFYISNKHNTKKNKFQLLTDDSPPNSSSSISNSDADSSWSSSSS
jgi:hypothetical protein